MSLMSCSIDGSPWKESPNLKYAGPFFPRNTVEFTFYNVIYCMGREISFCILMVAPKKVFDSHCCTATGKMINEK